MQRFKGANVRITGYVWHVPKKHEIVCAPGGEMARHAGGVTRFFQLSFAGPKESCKEKDLSGELLPLEIYVRPGARCVTSAVNTASTQLAFGSAIPSLIYYGSELMPASSARALSVETDIGTY